MTFAAHLAARRALLALMENRELEGKLQAALNILATAAEGRRPILICGNGGSAADAQHIVSELVGRFGQDRPPIAAMALGAALPLLTASANDFGYEAVFRREVAAFGAPDGVLVAISTSGRSRSVIAAAETARQRGMSVVALTGATGGELAAWANIVLAVPDTDTALVQEGHALLYHYLCAALNTALGPARPS